MLTYKRFLTIAGSDSGGGAGIQADIKTATALGCFASSAITSVTAQNTVGVIAVEPLSVDIVRAQIDAVISDIGVDAIKIGMLCSGQIAATVAACIKGMPNIVLDPVMVATSGDRLSKDDLVCEIIKILPCITLLTPNIAEAEALTGIKIENENDMERVWHKLQPLGLKALLIKGGHALWQGGSVIDTLFMSDKIKKFTTERIDTPNTHGTGCTLSSAIAANLALGAASLEDSVKEAIFFTHKAIAKGREYKLGAGHGPLMWND